MSNLTVHNGDTIKIIHEHIEPKSVQTCVTRVPCYDNDDVTALELTPEEYIANMVEVFCAVKDALKDNGTLWVNVTDSHYRSECNITHLDNNRMNIPTQEGLIGIPWMLAFALRENGWYLRQDIILNKPDVSMESAKVRCDSSHEYLFLLSKSAKYYFDSDAIKEQCSDTSVLDFKRRKTLDNKGKGTGTYEDARPDLSRSREAYMPKDFMRNKRSVWTSVDIDYTVYHQSFIKTCILAGSKPDDLVLDPFGGSGNSVAVGLHLNRNVVICNLNEQHMYPIYEKNDKEKCIFQDIDVISSLFDDEK